MKEGRDAGNGHGEDGVISSCILKRGGYGAGIEGVYRNDFCLAGWVREKAYGVVRCLDVI